MTFLNVVEIESAVIALASTYPTLTQLITLPHKTVEGRTSHALRIGTSSCKLSGVLLVSGTHAREWGGPDILVNLATDLLEAYIGGSGLVYGGTSFSDIDVAKIVQNVDLIVFPDLNPDGRHYSQTVFAMWRKNRNPASSGGVASRIGVDLNRNYDFLWDFPTAFKPAAVTSGTLASTDPGSDLFHGTAPFSEPETKNVRWLFDNYSKLRRFVDLHSYSGTILHPWGDDENQTTTPSMNFKNPAWNGQRGVEGDAYAEFIDSSDLSALQSLADSTKAAIAGVRGQSYTVAQSFHLPGWGAPYPTSGASDDWAFSRHYGDPSKPLVLGYVIEFNKNWGQFFPTWVEMEKIILDVDAGLVRFCRNAVPTFYWFRWCWWKAWLWAIWKKVFPPELWGPYGPWSLIKRVLDRAIAPVIRLIKKAGGR
ncbi:MAG TPA: M14 family metallopeptidase [Acidimicrobiia bacterium]|nr:M14 family metallopeptidase [Acidimicrobiia bacterium]